MRCLQLLMIELAASELLFAGYGPFVMNMTDEIQQAIVDFNSGRFGKMN